MMHPVKGVDLAIELGWLARTGLTRRGILWRSCRKQSVNEIHLTSPNMIGGIHVAKTVH